MGREGIGFRYGQGRWALGVDGEGAEQFATGGTCWARGEELPGSSLKTGSNDGEGAEEMAGSPHLSRAVVPRAARLSRTLGRLAQEVLLLFRP